MTPALSGQKIAVLGGDERELILIPELVKLGAEVWVAGFDSAANSLSGVRLSDLDSAVRGARVVILPMPGTDGEGVIRAVYSSSKLILQETHIQSVTPGALILIGVAKEFLRAWARKYQVQLVEVAELDDVAIYNSIPTAEGAIQIAMQEVPITIHGSESFVLGFGRVGQTLARTLKALGAKTTVVARSPTARASGFAQGHNVISFEQLQMRIGVADIIFNTVPALILTEGLLGHVKSGALIVDLATQPGGTDFRAADRLGIKAILAPGLPGKVAPLTAGRILAQTIPPLILKYVG
ncbi:MAG: dipicolinate synthase subunit DpsA [Clostridia bacterium]|nr:dipicolinate synthase subunit DpsA [Clostridia bacterium]